MRFVIKILRFVPNAGGAVMPVIEELIKVEKDGSISFGNYELDTKAKLDNFDVNGDIYKVKTYNEITKLEENGNFVYESVPGTAVNGLTSNDNSIKFYVEGNEDAQITLGLEADTDYKVLVDGVVIGNMKTNISGKLSLSVELSGRPVKVEVNRM